MMPPDCRLLLDTANIDEIASLISSDCISGVTTNPSLMAKEEKGDYITKLSDIAALISDKCSSEKHLSVEVISSNPEEMYDQALLIRDALSGFRNVDLHIKIPSTISTLEIITKLARKEVKVNATACVNALQAKIVADAGAAVVSFFFNRGLDAGIDMEKEIAAYSSYSYMGPDVICGSIRKPEDVPRCWRNGATYVTVSMKVFKEMLFHHETAKAIKQFETDIEKWQK